jgi:hypothetical protein
MANSIRKFDSGALEIDTSISVYMNLVSIAIEIVSKAAPNFQ